MTFAEFKDYMKFSTSSFETITISFELSNGDEILYDRNFNTPVLLDPETGTTESISWEKAYTILNEDGQFEDCDED